MSMEPKCIEVEVGASTGGKVQIVQFKLSNDFTFSYSEKYSIPSGWSQQRIDQWTEERIEQIKAKVDDFAQTEQDALLESSDWYKG